MSASLTFATPPEAAEKPAPSLRARAIRASVWTLVAMGGDRTLRLISNLILTRLLFPEAFGLMSLVFVVIQGLQMLSDVGIGPSIIQNERGDEPAFLNTVWTVQILRGAVIWLAVMLLAIPAAHFYGKTQLMWLLPMAGVTALISGFDSTARFTVNRHLALGKITVLDFFVQALAMVVTVVWAWVSRDVWSLVAGAIFAALVRMAVSHFLLPGIRDAIGWERTALHDVLHFGKWIFLSSAVGFLGAQADRLIFPKLISLELLGIYSIAFALSQFPDQIVASLAGKVIFPALSQLAHLPRKELRGVVLRNRRPFLWGVAVPLALLSGFGDQLVYLLYDRRYHAAGWMLAVLSLGLWPRMLSNTIAPSLLAIGQARYFPPASAFRVVWVCSALPLAYFTFGMWGAVAAVACGGLGEYGISGYGLWRHGLLCAGQDAVATLLWVAALAAVLFARWGIGLPTPFAGSA